MTATKLEELRPGEVAWIESQLDQATKFVDTYSPGDSGQPLTLEALDRAFGAWIKQNVNDTRLVNEVINAVGITFGEFLVQSAEFEWVIASDEHGTDLAIIALRGHGDVLVYPANFVAKRWERRETNFLSASFTAIDEQVAKLRRSST